MTSSRGIGMRAAVGAALLLGVIAAPAAASNYGPRGGGHGYCARNSCHPYAHSYAGTIVIDGCRTTIRIDRDPRNEIRRALRRAGYRSYVRHGRIIVNYGWRRPSVRWFAQGYHADLRWTHRCLSIDVYSSQRGSCHRHTGNGNRRGRSYNRWAWSDRHPARPWQPNRCR